MHSRQEFVDHRLVRGAALGQFDYPTLVAFLYTLADVSAVVLAGLLAHAVTSDGVHMATSAKMAVPLGLLLTYLFFNRLGLYDSWRGRSLFEQTGRLIAGWLAVVTSLITVAYLLDVGAAFSRGWLTYWLLFGWSFLVLARSAAALGLRVVRARGWNHKRVVVVGGGSWAGKVIRRLNNSSWLGLDVVAVLDEATEKQGERIDGVPVKGGFELLPGMIQNNEIEEVWICLPITSGRSGQDDSLDRVLKLLRHSTVTQRLVPNFAEMRLLNRPMTQIMDVSLVNLNLSPMRIGTNRLLKALEDRLIALMLVLVTAPLMVLIAIAVKVSSKGPVLFVQRRHGWDGRPMRMYKFRTMYVHEEGDGTVTQACRDDMRITPLGRFLRQTSLDELPQFLNVLQGRMSVVGPRPHAIEHNHFYMDQIDDYMQRHKVKPGVTGWAQVNGLRGETNTLDKMRRRIEYDLFYIENWTVWMDIKIILLTLIRGFRHPNAY